MRFVGGAKAKLKSDRGSASLAHSALAEYLPCSVSSLLLASGTFKYLRRPNCRFIRPWYLVRHLVIFKFVVNLAKSAPQLQGAGWAFQLGGQATEVDSQFASYRKKERASSPQHVSLASGAPVSLEQCSAVVGGLLSFKQGILGLYGERLG